MKNITLRPYQDRGVGLTWQAIRDGFTRILFWLATGGGKSIVFLKFVTALLGKDKKILFLVKRQDLVFQAHSHFERSGIDSSILIADNPGFDPKKRLQVASIDTIIRRDLDFLVGFDFVIVDEAHDATSPSYQEFFQICLETYKIKYFIGLTATPFPMGKKVHDFWQCCIKPIEMHELRDQGFLVDVNLHHPEGVDLSDVKVDRMTGDFKQKSLSAKMRDLKTVGDSIDLYKRHGEGKTGLCFCVDKDHSKSMALAFNKAGIEAAHADESTPRKQRVAIIEELKKAALERRQFVICNVNIFSTGVDIPEAEVGVMNRPTMSEVLYIQQVGRLLRPHYRCLKCKSHNDQGIKCRVCGFDQWSYVKRYAIILDQGDNTSRFGHPYNVRYAALKKEDLETRKILATKERQLYKTCSNCFRVYPAHTQACPHCGFTSTREKFHITVDGELRPYDEFHTFTLYYQMLEEQRRINVFKESWTACKMFEKFGDSVMAYKHDFNIPSWVPTTIKKQKEEKLTGKMYR